MMLTESEVQRVFSHIRYRKNWIIYFNLDSLKEDIILTLRIDVHEPDAKTEKPEIKRFTKREFLSRIVSTSGLLNFVAHQIEQIEIALSKEWLSYNGQ